MEYYNEFKLTMETNAKAKEASEILINRLNKGFEIDNTYDLLSFTISKPRKRSLFKIISPLPFCLKLLKYSY